MEVWGSTFDLARPAGRITIAFASLPEAG